MRDNIIQRLVIASIIVVLSISSVAGEMTVTINADPTSGNSPLAVSFSYANETYGPHDVMTSLSWDFGDGDTSTAASPSHTYTSADTYTVTLTLNYNTSMEQHTATDTETITVSTAPPVAAFSYSPTTVFEDEEVTFTDDSTNSPNDWSWNFGDGYTLTGPTHQNPTHTFTNYGTFTVSLTASNAGGSNTTTTDIEVLSASVLPGITMTTNITSGTAPLVVKFTGNSTNSPYSTLLRFGDGSTSSSYNVTHTYTTAGTYKANMSATNSYGTTTTASTTITVSGGSLPVASFYANKTSGYPPMTVKFYDTTSNSPTSWHWTFGTIGGTNTSTSQNPTFTYTTAGSYNVTLKAWNAAGNDNETKINYIYVGTEATTATTATPTPTPTQVLPQMTVAFTEATPTATAVPTSSTPEGIFAEPYRINSVIEELVKLFKHLLGWK